MLTAQRCLFWRVAGNPSERRLQVVFRDFRAGGASRGHLVEDPPYGSELTTDLRESQMLDADEPYLLEVIVPYTEHVLPMIPQGKSAKEMLID